MTVTPQDVLFFKLIANPFLVGLSIVLPFFLRDRFASRFSFPASVIIAIMSAKEFIPLLSQYSEGSRSWLFATPLIWVFTGTASTILMMSYLRIVGFAGYFFTLGVRIAGICTGAIVTQGIIFPIILKHNSPASQIALIEYGKILIFAAFLLVFFGWRLSLLGVIAAFKKAFPFIFSLSATLELFAGKLYGKFLSDLSWQVPGMDSPESYRMFFTLIFGIISGLPRLNPLAKLSKSANIDEKTGALRALIRTGVLKPDPLPLRRAWSAYKKPERWTVFREKPDGDPYMLQLRPPGTAIWNRITMSRLDVLVYQYTQETLSDAEKFTEMTHANLMARDATIVEDRISKRHGVMSHECLFTQDFGWSAYGYVVRFIIHGNEFVIHWLSSSSRTFRQYRRDVDEFIDSFRFDLLKNDREAER